MKNIIAIDPGASGGIARQDKDGIVTVMRIPATYGAICSALRSMSDNDTVVYLEESIAFSNFSSIAKLIAQNHFIQGVLMATGVSLQLVKPQKWQKDIGLGSKASVPKAKEVKDKKARSAAKSRIDREWKKKLLSHAERFFPAADPVDLYTCDALLILKYAQQDLRQNQ